jgi:aspartyl-tRNA(Asn)/glutamyl-tRNA(Gln) amidotransferase subunit A
MHEAALGSTTRNPHYGDTINPHRAGHTPGGSSGGSGAAVAAELCDAALGTDTLGSIRIPAAYCGVYGLKPTHGAVDDDGLVALSRAFDSIGPLARDLDTLGKVWAVIKSSLVPSDVAGDERIFVLRDLSGVAIEGGVRTGYQRALAALRAPTEIALADPPIAIRTAAFASIGRQLAVDLGADRDAPGLSDELTFMMRAAEAMPLRPDVLARTRATLREALGEDGVLVMPTAPQAAFPHTPRPPAGQADFTGLANVAGLPALAVPAGRDESGLPVGVQLVGPANAEGRLIALARTLEPALGGGVPPQGD